MQVPPFVADRLDDGQAGDDEEGEEAHEHAQEEADEDKELVECRTARKMSPATGLNRLELQASGDRQDDIPTGRTSRSKLLQLSTVADRQAETSEQPTRRGWK